MSIDVSWTTSALSHLARVADWDDEISITTNQTRRITLESTQNYWRFCQRIITAVLRAFEALASTLLNRPIVLIDHTKKQKDLTDTLTTLRQMFGTSRVDRNLAWCGIDIPWYLNSGRCLSKRDFATIFHCFELITKEDVEELLAELNTSDVSCVRGIIGEELAALRQQYNGKRQIEECTPEEIRTLETILLPFSRPEHQFWNNPNGHKDTISFPVTPFGMIETVAWAQHLLRTKKLPLRDWEAFFGKRFAQPQLPKNLILEHPNHGYICFSHLVERGGASKRLFRSLHPQNVLPIILYRGTRGPMPGDRLWDTTNSWLEDLRRELGSSGPIATYEETKQLLDQPELGFVNTPDQKVSLITHSIGGAQGQRDALMFHNRVYSITTNCSPGVDTDTAKLFRNVMSTPREQPMIITHNIDTGDIVDTVGDEHIGGKCPFVRLTFRRLSPTSSTQTEEPAPWTTTNRLHDFLFSGLSSLFSNIAGIFDAHVRAITAYAYREEIISTDNPETSELAAAYAQHKPPHFDPSWEQARRFICPVPSPGFVSFARGHLPAM